MSNNYEKLYGSDLIRLYKFSKKLSNGKSDLRGFKFDPTEYFAIYSHPDFPQVVVFPVLKNISGRKTMNKTRVRKLKDLGYKDAWQELMEYYRCECAGALATGDINYDIDQIKSDEKYLEELWELNK